LRLFGREIFSRRSPAPPARQVDGWRPFAVVRDPFPGAWQQNQELTPDTSLTYFAVYACVSMIAADIGKLELRLVEQDADGIWTETTNPAYSPVLRKPNRYQLTGTMVEQWILSKLVHGNAYVLKERDNRGVVVALYVLDPARVVPLVAPDGAVYYQLGANELGGLAEAVVVPARQVIHDPMLTLFHPLVGVSPLYACGLSALAGQNMQRQTSNFFANGANPGGVLMAPMAITPEQAAAYKTKWEEYVGGANQGRIAVLDRGLEYKPLTMSAVDAQLIDQLKWSAETICSAFHVPPYMVHVGPPPPYANIEPLVQLYYNECLQSLITKFERSLDDGLELATNLGTEFAVDDLLLLDTGTRTKAAHDSIIAGALAPNEARRKYFGLGSVDGGASPYLQQQMYSLAALAARDANPTPAPVPPSPPVDPAGDMAATLAAIHVAALREGLYAA